MGQQVSTGGSITPTGPRIVVPEAPEKIEATLQKFNLASKSGIGVHMFCFSPPPHLTTEKVYIASEVTDENDVLDVKYSEWKKKFIAPESSSATTRPAPGLFKPPESKLKVIWTPTHHFSSGRLAMVAVTALLNQGYTMEECNPENEI